MFTVKASSLLVRTKERALDNIARIIDVGVLCRTKSFSQTYYEQQVGRVYQSRIAAIWNYVFHGSRIGTDCSPIYSTLWLKSQGVVVRNLADYIRNWNSFEDKTPHPLFDPRVQIETGNSQPSKYGPLESFSSTATVLSILPYLSDNQERKSITFGELCDYGFVAPRPPQPPVCDKSVSVIVDDVGSINRAREVIKTVNKAGPDSVFEIILVPPNGRRDLYRLLGSLELVHDNVRVCRRSVNMTRASALNHAVSISFGHHLLFMHVGHRFVQASVTRMVESLERGSSRIVQPLVLDTNGLIWSAGIAFPFSDPTPVPWLRGISPLTAEMPESFYVQGAQFPFMVGRLEDSTYSYFSKRDDEKWMDVNASLRLVEGEDNSIEVLVGAEVTRVMKSPYEPTDNTSYLSKDVASSWVKFGLRQGVPRRSTTLVSDWPGNLQHTTGVADFRMRKPDVRPRTAGGTPRLRWSIKTAAPSIYASDDNYRWGDSYFAASLQDALVRLGQIVTVDSVESREKATGYLDDVVLNLRGYEPIVTVKGAVNITWVISHPDLVTPKELQSSQIVYAASHYWAEAKSSEWSVPIKTLLQCTDSRLFYPNKLHESSDENIVFVGNTDGRDRTLVNRVIEAGKIVDIYGRGWEDERLGIRRMADHIDNSTLRDVYGSAGLILNDHWPSMREWGFMSNRAFDVVASGGRVLSDSVQGFPDELSKRMALSYDVDGVIRNGSREFEKARHDAQIRQSAAEYVLEHHTFDIRATQILNDVINLLGEELVNYNK